MRNFCIEGENRLSIKHIAKVSIKFVDALTKSNARVCVSGCYTLRGNYAGFRIY